MDLFQRNFLANCSFEFRSARVSSESIVCTIMTGLWLPKVWLWHHKVFRLLPTIQLPLLSVYFIVSHSVLMNYKDIQNDTNHTGCRMVWCNTFISMIIPHRQLPIDGDIVNNIMIQLCKSKSQPIFFISFWLIVSCVTCDIIVTLKRSALNLWSLFTLTDIM